MTNDLKKQNYEPFDLKYNALNKLSINEITNKITVLNLTFNMQIPEPNDSTPKSILITQLLYAMSEANYINSNLKNKDLECEIAQLKANEISLSEKIVNLKYDLTEVIENNKLINYLIKIKNF
jgi:hypothetical protein